VRISGYLEEIGRRRPSTYTRKCSQSWPSSQRKNVCPAVPWVSPLSTRLIAASRKPQANWKLPCHWNP